MKSLMVFFLLLFSSISLGQKLSARDSVETMGDDDIFAIQEDSSSTYTWRKVFYSDFFIQLNAQAWATRKTFTLGATFSAGSWGAVTFSDSVTLAGTVTTLGVLTVPTADNTGQLGVSSRSLFKVDAQNIYVDNIYIQNSGDSTDTGKWTYDGTNVTVDKPLALSKDLAFDSSFVMKNTAYGVYDYVIANVADSVLTLQDTSSVVLFSLPGAVTNMEKIEFASGEGKGVGTIIKLTNIDDDYPITFIDLASDGNLQLAGNFVMAEYDYIELIYINDGGTWYWIETGRSNN